MAVADVLVSKVLELLISGIYSEEEQKVKLLVGVRKEVKMLTDNLHSIQAVLFDAEKRQLKEETVKLWLRRLKNILYDIDDVLDDWSTELLKSKIEGDDYEYAPKPKRAKGWSFSLSSLFCFREVGFRNDIAVKIRELNESLDVIAKQKIDYNFLPMEGNGGVERVMTTSVVNMPEVKRREQDENKVINLLLSETGTPNPHVISVVGMGGIGKTTLTKMVYNEDRVKSHFDKTIWVCVSDAFDENRIAKAILESLADAASNFVELQSKVRKIRQHIEGKKFLLVLDDVWNEDSNKWGRVEEFLRCGSSGSKVLVTTRSEKVSEIMGHRDHMIRLGLLSNEDCWSIFSQLVFLESTSMQYNSSLVEIGRKIVARCKGLPLAVKTIGGLLQCKDSVEWQKVLDSELWEVEEVERGVLAPLLLSYHDLPSALKQCFLYCVIFPKDHRMSKTELVGMWMSQGYLRATRSKDMMEIGEEYFQQLAMRSFFQDFEECFVDKNNSYCKMHDLVHDFGQSIMKNESVSLEVSSTYCVDPNEIRHAVIVVAQRKASFPSCVCNFKTLRSLRFLSTDRASMVHVALPCIFNELMCLRSVTLSDCCIEEIPSNISKLIHLRELDLSGNLILRKLPETICNLYNLQTLVLDECAHMESLPQGMGKLINLRCLYNFQCESLRLPKGLGRLSGLQRLSWLNICDHGEEEEEASLSLRDVENLNHLGGYLEIRWSRQHKADVDVRDAGQAQLKAKKHLTQLVLCFSFSDGAEWRKEGEDEELLEALEPPPNLKYLEIYYYQGIKMCCSSWISSLSFLRKLFLYYWRNCEQLPALGKLPSLESLAIYDFERLKKVGGEFLGIDHHHHEVGATVGTAIILFPKLAELEFSWMDEWEEWNYEGEVNDEILKIMPCLSTLTLWSCRKLNKLPYYIRQNTSLKHKTWNCKALHL